VVEINSTAQQDMAFFWLCKRAKSAEQIGFCAGLNEDIKQQQPLTYLK